MRGASLIRSLPPRNFPSCRERDPFDPPLMEWGKVRRGASLIWCLSTMRWKEASKAHTLRGMKFNSWLPTTWRERDIVAPLIWGEETLPSINPPHMERGSCLPHLERGKCLPHLKVPPLTDKSYEMTPHKISKDTSHSHLQVLKPSEITYLATQGVCNSSEQCKITSSTSATKQPIAI